VVDNASKDGSAEGLGDLRLPLIVIPNKENRGFSAACNQGAKVSGADYLLFLNPDVRLSKASLTAPLAFMEQPENQHIGIVGIRLVDNENKTSRTCARFPTARRYLYMMLGLDRLLPRRFPGHFMTEWDHEESREVNQVIGAFFLTRRSVYEALGGFDERFFVYFEDVDFSLRAQQAGWHSFYLASAQAYHKGGGTSEQVRAMRLFYFLRSRTIYGHKHFGRCSATSLTLAMLILEPLARVVSTLGRGRSTQLRETLTAYSILYSTLIQGVLEKHVSKTMLPLSKRN
jgi:GT2 family glycosyltransferase